MAPELYRLITARKDGYNCPAHESGYAASVNRTRPPRRGTWEGSTHGGGMKYGTCSRIWICQPSSWTR
jgi:hypothetical protein